MNTLDLNKMSQCAGGLEYVTSSGVLSGSMLLEDATQVLNVSLTDTSDTYNFEHNGINYVLTHNPDAIINTLYSIPSAQINYEHHYNLSSDNVKTFTGTTSYKIFF